LAQLAQTTAFLGDVQVRILDHEQQLLAAAGIEGRPDELTWVFQNVADAGPGQRVDTMILVAPGRQRGEPAGPVSEQRALPPLVAASAPSAISVRRLPSPWGDRLIFESESVQGEFAGEARLAQLEQAQLITGTVPFSRRVDLSLEVVRAPLLVTAPIESGEQVVGYVELSSPPDFVTATLAVIRWAFLLAAAVATGVSVALGLVVSRGLTAPLAGLGQATARMNSGDLTARAPVHGHDEIALLAGQFNQMAVALEASFAALAAERDALRRFVADASHELRTPITALRTFFELLLDNAGPDQAVQQEFLQESQSQIDRLERLTNNLLNLSRLEGGLIQLRPAAHDLNDLLRNMVAPFNPLAQERQIDLRVALPTAALSIYCDRGQLESALGNLIDNALKFTPAGGQVTVGAEPGGDGVILWVTDNGPGIAADELPYIFERFHRGREATAGGSGLGLAIVQSIVQAHGGQVEVLSQVGVGSRFVLKLPGATGAPSPG
jgi:signal transduction histidine kinase